MIVACTVTPAFGSAGNLMAAPYRIESEGFDFGAMPVRKTFVDHPWVAGRVVTAQAPDVVEMVMTIKVEGASTSAIITAISNLRQTLQQYQYQMTMTFDGGTVGTWVCEAAQIHPGGLDDRWSLLNVPVTVVVPRSPIPLAGGF